MNSHTTEAPFIFLDLPNQGKRLVVYQSPGVVSIDVFLFSPFSACGKGLLENIINCKVRVVLLSMDG
ncbi:hypothetical protein N9O24_00625 [bacterium]|nr:hypothetical protein [bacterium]